MVRTTLTEKNKIGFAFSEFSMNFYAISKVLDQVAKKLS
jgi:hypothetical protein